MRKLRQANPDYYLTTSDSGTTLADLRRDPRIRRLKAIRQGHFAVLADRSCSPEARPATSCSRSRVTSTRMRFAELDAVTVAFGIPVELIDPLR